MRPEGQRVIVSGRSSGAELAQAIQWMFLGELLCPGGTVWIVAPRLDDAPILDNRSGAFEHLEPSWSLGAIVLSHVIVRLAASGSRVVLISQDSPQNSDFRLDLKNRVRDLGLDDLVRVSGRDWLGSKGILTSRVALQGALAVDRNGIGALDDAVFIDTRSESLTALRVQFASEYPGEA